MDFSQVNIESWRNLINGLAEWLAVIAGAIACGGIIYAGMLFSTANGNEDKISKAKKFFWFSLAGGLIILFAYAILLLIQNLLSGQETLPAPSL